MTSRLVPEVNCGPYQQQQHHRISGVEGYERQPEEDIEELIRARQSQYGHLFPLNSNILSKGGGGSQLHPEKTPKFQTKVKLPALKTDSDFSFDALSSKNDDEIPIDSSREPSPDGPLSPPQQEGLLLQKPGVRSAEIFSVKVQPPETSYYQEEPTEEEEEENKEGDTDEKPAQKVERADVPLSASETTDDRIGETWERREWSRKGRRGRRIRGRVRGGM